MEIIDLRKTNKFNFFVNFIAPFAMKWTTNALVIELSCDLLEVIWSLTINLTFFLVLILKKLCSIKLCLFHYDLEKNSKIRCVLDLEMILEINAGLTARISLQVSKFLLRIK